MKKTKTNKIFLVFTGLSTIFFSIMACGIFAGIPSDATQSPLSETQISCPETSLPWDLSWISTNLGEDVINRINLILENTGLTEQGGAIFSLSYEFEINPAFALAMFRKEVSFAAPNTRANRNNNLGNITPPTDYRVLRAVMAPCNAPKLKIPPRTSKLFWGMQIGTASKGVTNVSLQPLVNMIF